MKSLHQYQEKKTQVLIKEDLKEAQNITDKNSYLLTK